MATTKRKTPDMTKHEELMNAVGSINTKVQVDNALLADTLREIAVNSRRMAKRALTTGMLTAVNLGLIISVILLFVYSLIK